MSIPKSILPQIKDAWSKLSHPVEIILHQGRGDDAHKFKSFVESLRGLNEKIVIQDGEGSDVNASSSIDVRLQGEDVRVTFAGVPLGHELSSFVLAPLVLSGDAKMPDPSTVRRIRSIQGPVQVTTYVSLTCENCPTVVQSFNVMAALNPHLSHTMVDGSLDPEGMKAKGILSVPTVFVNGKNFSTGRQDMSSLLSQLEDEFGAEEAVVEEEHHHADVVVVGGGPAGASAAIYTARKGLKTIIVSENIGGQVRETKGIENSISTPYIEGPELADKLKQHVLEYPITILENQSVGSVKMGETKTMALKGGVRVHAPVVIAATGASWRKLGVAGETEYMGRGVAFCPHCDGPFYRDKEIVVVGGGNSGTEAALDLANICSKVTLLERNTAIKADQVLVDKVHRAENIEVITSAQTQEILGDGQTVQGLRYKNLISGTEAVMDVAGVFIQIGLVPNSSWIGDHLDVTSYGEIQVNERNQTSAEGVFAAGDVSTVPYKQIVIAMGEGAKAGLSAFEYLLKRPQ